MCKITCYALISIVIAGRKVVMEEDALWEPYRDPHSVSCLFFIPATTFKEIGRLYACKAATRFTTKGFQAGSGGVICFSNSGG